MWSVHYFERFPGIEKPYPQVIDCVDFKSAKNAWELAVKARHDDWPRILDPDGDNVCVDCSRKGTAILECYACKYDAGLG